VTNLEAADHAGIFTSHAHQEQIGLICRQPSGEITNGAAEQNEADIAWNAKHSTSLCVAGPATRSRG